MNIEECVQHLKERFDHLDLKEIEEKTKLYLINKNQACSLQEENLQINEKTLKELIHILSKELERKKKDHLKSLSENMPKKNISYNYEKDEKQKHHSFREDVKSLNEPVEVKKNSSTNLTNDRSHSSNASQTKIQKCNKIEPTLKEETFANDPTPSNISSNIKILDSDEKDSSSKFHQSGESFDQSYNELPCKADEKKENKKSLRTNMNTRKMGSKCGSDVNVVRVKKQTHNREQRRGASMVENDKANEVVKNEPGVVENGETVEAGNNETSKIRNNETSKIRNNETSEIRNNETNKVSNNKANDIPNNKAETIPNNKANDIPNNKAEDIPNNKANDIPNSKPHEIQNDKPKEMDKREDISAKETNKRECTEMYVEEKKEGVIEMDLGVLIGAGNNSTEKANATEKQTSTMFEVLFRKSLLENDNIKRNISSKNFYIIGEDMLVNITIILDRIISELINHYRNKQFDATDQEEHFENFFKVLYKLLSNISYNSKEEKYKIIKFSNHQIKTSFSTNYEIFNLIKLLFEILNFNTSYCDSKVIMEYEGTNSIPNEIIENMVWKFENIFSDKESILFEFVLSCVNIIMNMTNKKVPRIRMSNEKMVSSDYKTEQQTIPENEISKKYFEDPKKCLEKLSNNISPINNKILVIHEKNKQEKQALSDIRKLHNEKYAVHKNYANGNLQSEKLPNSTSNRKNNAYGKSYDLSAKNKGHSTGSPFANDNELGEKNSLKKGTKRIKHFFKNLFKKG
ncbi:hypothetical protein, conserved [Plasmodium gonderi]|uniref:PUB domain-containing protein n=1 Tax=Plasmodium gonderi TaxID=77519 RepID=A0A1Y1JSR9_PLAGO|nr:hypothetical protein, conserved [Plasmodium gonderi]GAW83463.1 hypothetical protein, conserved [Plasmodium gonderi]